MSTPQSLAKILETYAEDEMNFQADEPIAEIIEDCFGLFAPVDAYAGENGWEDAY